MARLAAARDTHLTRTEIAVEALRQFDAGPREPSIRSLAAALNVAPTAIYHHFPSQSAIYQSVVELIWLEALQKLIEAVPQPFEADPGEVLVETALAIRRSFLAHYRAARYMAATPPANEQNAQSLELMANLFERLGLEGDEIGVAFHGYASFAFGAVLFAAERKAANELFGDDQPPGIHRNYRLVRRANRQSLKAIDKIPDLSVVDPKADEELFASGVRRVIESHRPKRRR